MIDVKTGEGTAVVPAWGFTIGGGWHPKRVEHHRLGLWLEGERWGAVSYDWSYRDHRGLKRLEGDDGDYFYEVPRAAGTFIAASDGDIAAVYGDRWLSSYSGIVDLIGGPRLELEVLPNGHGFQVMSKPALLKQMRGIQRSAADLWGREARAARSGPWRLGIAEKALTVAAGYIGIPDEEILALHIGHDLLMGEVAKARRSVRLLSMMASPPALGILPRWMRLELDGEGGAT